MASNRDQRTNPVRMALFVMYLSLGLWFVERGLFNEDEGWYLYAARQVDAGLMPVRDFVFNQGLVYPRVMAGMLDAGEGMILSARWISWVMLVLGLMACVAAGTRVSGRSGGFAALLVMASQPLMLSTGVLAKPYALCILLLSVGLLLIAAQDGLRVALGFVLLGLSAGTRLTLLIPISILCLAHFPRRGLWASGGLAAGLLLAFSPLVGTPVSSVVSQLIGFHLGDALGIVERLSWLGWQGGVLAFWATALGPGARGAIPGLRSALVFGVMVHALPGALHVEHTMVLAPLFAVALADRWPDRLTGRQVALGVMTVATAVVTGSHFVHLDKQVQSVQQVAEQGRWLAAVCPPSRVVFTPHLGIAVEANRRVTPGLEMGRFSASFTDPATLSSGLSADVGAIILTEGDAHKAGGLKDIYGAAVSAGWARRSIEPYGQFGERLWLLADEEGTLWAR